MQEYNPKKIEKKWQKYWEDNKTFEVTEDKKKEKFYSLIEFPYPSGEGLHVGHPRPFTAMDVVSRKKRMEGYNVLFPIGFDAFGLPTENYAIKTGRQPAEVTKENIANFTRQLKILGYSFDWSRVVDTTDPNYYKWTQWIFLQLFKHGLAYKKNQPINWCLSCKIGLANEEVVGGVCERCGGPVEKRNKEQWMLAITKYAESLLQGLGTVDYIERAKIEQTNWIGKSEGASVFFSVIASDERSEERGNSTGIPSSLEAPRNDRILEVFTTRPDTLFGATYMVLAPEHQLIEEMKEKIENWSEVLKYIEEAKKKTDIDRTNDEKEKTGVELKGIKAINPVNNEEIPVWVADYVLVGYGTGAIMAVPAHDERDFEFATKHKVNIKKVVAPYLKDSPREDKETEERDVITAIVKNPKDNTYLCLDWKTTPWKSFPTGGIEGDDLETAAKREVLEETGYTNIKFIKQIGDSVFAEFYRPHKDSNVFAHFKYLLFELQNDSKLEIDQKEKDQHEALWVKEEEIDSFINVWNQKLIWKCMTEGECSYTDAGIAINSEFINGLKTEEAKEKMINWLEEKGFGKRETNYKLRDWVFSRQRYWGEPIPLVDCKKCGGWVPLPEEELPLKLPEVEKYQPTDTGESPLASIEEWVNTTCPKCGGSARRETDTMPNWAGSSWYFLRYMDPNNGKVFASKENMKYWGQVDWYNGGMEHTVLHLLYSRFWNQFLCDIGEVPFKEPYKKRTSHGMILAKGGEKMSKSKGNVVNPDEMVEKFGADALRAYIMFMGPFDQAVEWDTNGLVGVKRFLDRVWGLQERLDERNKKQETRNKAIDAIDVALHKTIKKVTEDIDAMRFNTAIAKMMELVNEMMKEEEISITSYQSLVTILSPFAPHICAELWEQYGEGDMVWPKYDPTKIVEDEITIAIQVNGKVRDELTVSVDISEEEIKKLALESEKVDKWIDGKEPKKVIYVKGKLVSVVV
ncbi:class I tRNA ligase family protein [Patescibacteria group bacterium]|nr:class I tRNA ligase family protein [Patescibacteria group bacterium]